MTALDIIVRLSEAFAFVVLYAMLGFGPGFVIGMVLVNTFFAKGQPTYMDTHEENKKLAAQHNAQWTPSHERWQK
ncbi:MAG: hypothetical protein WD972_00070 [Candidatus Andersenbacteria bacterium]